MDRTKLLVLGVLCWMAAALDATLHLANGDLAVPLGMVSAGIGYVAVRRAMIRLRVPAPVRVPSEAR
jgi:hypothetical protein